MICWNSTTVRFGKRGQLVPGIFWNEPLCTANSPKKMPKQNNERCPRIFFGCNFAMMYFDTCWRLFLVQLSGNPKRGFFYPSVVKRNWRNRREQSDKQTCAILLSPFWGRDGERALSRLEGPEGRKIHKQQPWNISSTGFTVMFYKIFCDSACFFF